MRARAIGLTKIWTNPPNFRGRAYANNECSLREKSMTYAGGRFHIYVMTNLRPLVKTRIYERQINTC